MFALESRSQDIDLNPEKSIRRTKAELIRKEKLRKKYIKDQARNSRPPSPSEPGLTVGTNFLSLAEEDAGPSLWVEYRFSKHLEVGLQGSWVLYTGSDDFPHYGFRFQPDLKYYILPRHHKIMPFVGVGALFTQVHYKAYTSLPDDGMAGGPSFTAAKTTVENKRMLGYAFIFGFKKYLDRERHRLALEVYMGVGGKWKRFPGRSAERTAFLANRRNDPNVPTDFGFSYKYGYMYPNQYAYLPVCVKLGYRF